MQRIKHIRWNMICLILISVVGSPGEPTGIIDAHESDHIHTGLNQVVGFGWREHRLLPSTNNCRWLFVILAHHKIKQVQIIIYEMWRRETGRGWKGNETKVVRLCIDKSLSPCIFVLALPGFMIKWSPISFFHVRFS